VTSLVVAGASAHAAGPTRESVPIDETFAFDDCGFAVVEHDAFTLHFKSWYDAAGVRQRQLVTVTNAHITYTNPVTGDSVPTANPFVVQKRDNPDGTPFTGLFFAITGSGPVRPSRQRSRSAREGCCPGFHASIGPSPTPVLAGSIHAAFHSPFGMDQLRGSSLVAGTC
jgi:hypothetical protein